tara:strand:+ start:5509 stop:6201 length:693 start_codon:yes stop_codon:yes gene_type:complete
MWIKVETKLRNSPKVFTIAMRMGVPRITALGAVIEAWMIADSHAEENGFLKHLTFEALDEMVGVKYLGTAMNEVGWLVEVEGGLSFVDYTKHNGSTAKTRAEDAERQRKCRENKKAKQDEENKNKESVTPVTVVSQNSVTREEKRRIDNIYNAYPRKVGKADALKAIGKSLKKEEYEFLLKKTKDFALSRQAEDPQFTPYPSTWFNREHYHDEIEKVKPKPTGENFMAKL